MSFSMFPDAPAGRPRPKPYIQIKAGKCLMELQEGSQISYNISADLKKGTISLVKGSDDLPHFQWTDRVSGAVVDDFLVFPGDAALSKVNTGRDRDRVYLLKWHGGASRKFMFWMQDKSSEQDDENCRKFNEYINSPPGPDTESSTDIMRLFRNGGEASGASATNRAPTAPATSIGGFDFSQLLSGMGSIPARPVTSSTPAAALSAQDYHNAMMGGVANNVRTDLSEILRPDQVISSGILNDPDDLIPHLPEGQQTSEHLAQAVRSPQFQQAVGELGSAIEQDPSGAVISNVGLISPPSGVDFRDPVNSFLDAVQNTGTSTAVGSTSNNDGLTTPVRPQEEKDDDNNEDNGRMDESA